jgi:predicted small integral membrane protein
MLHIDMVKGGPPAGEWFLMWQSRIWNGQEEAFRMFTIVGVVFLVVVQREPTPD